MNLANILKELFLIRHAKSSWDNLSLADIHRPLNYRGNAIAPLMASYIKNRIEVDNFTLISSPAKKAISTALYFAQEYNYPPEKIIQFEPLYYGNEKDYLKCLHTIQNEVSTVFLFGHNPIIENMVGLFGNPYLGPVPTCAVFYIQLNSNDWNVSDFSQLKVINYYFPKLVLSIEK